MSPALATTRNTSFVPLAGNLAELLSAHALMSVDYCAINAGPAAIRNSSPRLDTKRFRLAVVSIRSVGDEPRLSALMAEKGYELVGRLGADYPVQAPRSATARPDFSDLRGVERRSEARRPAARPCRQSGAAERAGRADLCLRRQRQDPALGERARAVSVREKLGLYPGVERRAVAGTDQFRDESEPGRSPGHRRRRGPGARARPK